MFAADGNNASAVVVFALMSIGTDDDGVAIMPIDKGASWVFHQNYVCYKKLVKLQKNQLISMAYGLRKVRFLAVFGCFDASASQSSRRLRGLG